MKFTVFKHRFGVLRTREFDTVQQAAADALADIDNLEEQPYSVEGIRDPFDNWVWHEASGKRDDLEQLQNLYAPLPLNHLIKNICNLQAVLSQESRMELWRILQKDYCDHCGRADPTASCQCWNDE